MSIKDSPDNEPVEKICPMTLPNPEGPYPCCEDQCAWWQTYYKGDEKEYSECCIVSITSLRDMV
ncbi:MAG: hypothetical protein JRJ39_00565 [Deltaproteobacteria bacterium]|nr:hypothetical protein [Deltaproteobacteria bacterium]MBW1845602.1 hypothetical protein [Deltaproteobacteria bacterium]